MKNCGDEHLTEVFPFRPEMVGQDDPRVVLGKNSGLDSVVIWLAEMQRCATGEEQQDILMRVKNQSMSKKRLLTSEEFHSIVQAVLG